MMDGHTHQAPHSHCFRCQNGCVHVVCGNTSLTLTPIEFLVLAEAINALRLQLRSESKSKNQQASGTHDVALIM
jgi:hypothetical protein